MKRNLILLLIVVSFAMMCSAADASNTVFLNRINTGQKIILVQGSSYLPAEDIAARLNTYTAWFPSSNIVVFNGVIINDFIHANGLIYVSAKELTKACGGTLKYDKKTRNLYITANTAQAAGLRKNSPAVSSESIPISSKYSNMRQPAISLTPSSVPQSQNTSSLGELQTVYPQSTAKGGTTVRPVNSGGVIMDGLRMPPNATISGIPAPESRLTTKFTDVPALQSKGNFSPKTGKNAVFSVTVTNIEEISVMKNKYNASSGNKYFVVYVSQQNISSEVQIYTGKFTFVDENSKVYDYLEGLSNYWLAILKPGGVNYGYLVFEVPKDSRPARLVLNALNQPPLTINLTY